MSNSFVPFWDRKKKITDREIEILELERKGLSIKKIAELKRIKPNSVSFMKWKLNKKLNKIYIPNEVSEKEIRRLD